MSNKTQVYFSSVIQTAKDLTPREKDILDNRLKKTKLRKIARKYSVSPERIRQIERSALKKIIQKRAQLLLFD
jgi:DNA-directed RNA polymerase sigma subunit (sigma70/sigma32)